MSTIKLVNRYTSTFLFWSTAITAGGFFMVIIIGVMMRYVVKEPFLGSHEVSRLLFIWATFLSASLAYRRMSHIAISFFVDKLPEIPEKIISAVVYLLTLLFFLVLGYHSLSVIRDLWPTSLPVLGISQGWLYIPLPVMAVIIALFCTEQIQDTITTLKEKL
jgi:TRAP-type C4-dicarboxylate transport system permease small subunit